MTCTGSGRRVRRVAVAAAAAVATVALAGCGSDGSGWPTGSAASATAGAPAPTTADTTPTTTSAATSPAAGAGSGTGGDAAGGNGGGTGGGDTPGGGTTQPTRCTTAELKASLVDGDAAAGSVYQTLVLSNTSGRTCTLRGFPGVSYTHGPDHAQLGPSAAMVGARGDDVRLGPGGAAGAQLKLVNVQNYDAAVCRPTPSNGLRVYPPGDTASLLVARDGTGCAGTPPGDQLAISTLQAR